jgi:uncharacterized protein (DUF433 family)
MDWSRILIEVEDRLAPNLKLDVYERTHLTAEDIRACLAFAADRERRLRAVPAD